MNMSTSGPIGKTQTNVKTVEIQSAGWLYADTLISKPKVKEITS